MFADTHWAQWMKTSAICLFVALLTACATTANPLESLMGDSKYSPEFIKNNIFEKRTTAAEVRQKLGSPSGISRNYSRGKEQEVWTYERHEEGASGLAAMIHKYVPTGTSLQMYDAEASVSKAQGVMNDARTVSGQKSENKKYFNRIYIYLINGVVDSYQLS